MSIKTVNEKNKDWEINPDNYQTDTEGNFVLKKDGTPKKNPVDLLVQL